MKIVNRETFLALPEGILFAKYEPNVFEDLCIKGETWGNDFLVQQITDAIAYQGSDDFGDRLDESQSTGCSLPMDFNRLGRDGCFDDDQLFAIWERADVEALIARLAQTLEASP